MRCLDWGHFPLLRFIRTKLYLILGQVISIELGVKLNIIRTKLFVIVGHVISIELDLKLNIIKLYVIENGDVIFLPT